MSASWTVLSAASVGLELAGILAMLMAVISIVPSMAKARDAAQRASMVYFLTALLLLASSRGMLVLSMLDVLPLSEESQTLGWHSLFFLSMIVFFQAGKTFALPAVSKRHASRVWTILLLPLLSLLFTVLVFVVLTMIDANVALSYGDSLFDRSGMIHVIAFQLAALAAAYLYVTIRQKHVSSLLAIPFFLTFGVWSAVHVWELVTESWHLLPIGREYGIAVEQLISFIGSACLLYSFAKLPRIMGGGMIAEDAD